MSTPGKKIRFSTVVIGFVVIAAVIAVAVWNSPSRVEYRRRRAAVEAQQRDAQARRDVIDRQQTQKIATEEAKEKAAEDQAKSVKRMELIQKLLDAQVLEKIEWNSHFAYVSQAFYDSSFDDKKVCGELLYSEAKFRDKRSLDFNFLDVKTGKKVGTYDPSWGMKIE